MNISRCDGETEHLIHFNLMPTSAFRHFLIGGAFFVRVAFPPESRTPDCLIFRLMFDPIPVQDVVIILLLRFLEKVREMLSNHDLDQQIGSFVPEFCCPTLPRRVQKLLTVNSRVP